MIIYLLGSAHNWHIDQCENKKYVPISNQASVYSRKRFQQNILEFIQQSGIGFVVNKKALQCVLSCKMRSTGCEFETFC